MAKEIGITYTYLVVSILKLRPFVVFNLIAYTYIKSHTVILPQNSDFLLNLLFFLILALHNIICIFWAGQRRITDFDL